MNPRLARLLVWLGLLGPDRLRILVSSRRVRIENLLLVECAGGKRQPVNFLIDSGYSVTTMSLEVAEALSIPTAGQRKPKKRTGSAGKRTITVVEGSFRFWLSEEQRSAPFVAPIDFEEDQPKGVPALFGLKGIIDQLRWVIGPCRRPIEDVLGQCVLTDVRRAADRYPS